MKSGQIHSSRLPGGDLVSALFDREVMTFADRGAASNLIGDRWADIAADHAAKWADGNRAISSSDGTSVPVTRVDRLDATPRIAAAASRHGLQNPDLILVGQQNGHFALQAADAKFSIETARSKQVSPEVVVGLLKLREHLPELLPGLDNDFQIEPGIFLAPDYPLTHLMLDQSRRSRRGILRSTVQPDEVALVPVEPDKFWNDVEGASLIGPLAEVDDLLQRPDRSLLSGLYYFRLSRAAIGFWLDATKPLLLFNDVLRVNEPEVLDEVVRRARNADTAIGLVRMWNLDVDDVRNQRAAVEQVAGLPISGRELREQTLRIARRIGKEPPSANQVRRRLGAWYRRELRERVGPIDPPVENLDGTLRNVAAASMSVAPRLEQELERVIQEMVAELEARKSQSTV